jgi:hypothetical protein
VRGVVIFHFERDGMKSSLELHGDGSLTFQTSNYGSTARKFGSNNRTERLSAREAKKRWPSRARAIDKALKQTANEPFGPVGKAIGKRSGASGNFLTPPMAE